jgi:oligoendopeptidase F
MATPRREEVKEENTWNLSSLYTDESDWSADYSALEESLDNFETFQGTLAESAESIKAAFDFYLQSLRSLERLYVFAHLRSDADTGNSTALGDLQKVQNLYARLSSAASFLTPELLEIEEEKLTGYLEAPVLAEYKRMLKSFTRYKAHTLSQAEELLLAQGSEVFGTSQRIFSQLNNADLRFDDVKIGKESKPLTHSTYITFLKDENRAVREQAYSNYYRTFEAHKNCIAATYASALKKNVYLASVRKFPSAIESSLFADDVPLEVYTNLIDTVEKRASSLHRYYDLRKKQLGLSPLKMYDTYVPLVENIELKHTYEEAVDIISESLAPLGTEYVDTLNKGLTENRWVDKYENVGKRSGAYSSGCYDSAPYILMNYKEDSLNDVFTLTHEAGHSMHSYFSNRAQSYQDHGYTIFVAEVASTFNELLLSAHLRKKHQDDPKVLAFLINQQIDDIKATFFRQTMFAEFEYRTHQMAEANQPLTVDSFTELYQGLLAKFFGSSVEIESKDALECFRIPHFYSAFYVYKYATGLAAAIALSERVLSGDKESVKRYLHFLQSGCSSYPLELLEDAGVDLRTADPLEATCSLFENLVGQLDQTLSLKE